MATISIGSDTGGSTRAPASYCGIVGLKPSTARMPSDGVFPLSPSFDAAGPMGNSVACVSIIDSIMAGGTGVRETAFTAAGLRLAIPDGYLMDDLDTEVTTAFDAAIDRLRDAGVNVQKIRLEALEAMRPSNNIKSNNLHPTIKPLENMIKPKNNTCPKRMRKARWVKSSTL